MKFFLMMQKKGSQSGKWFEFARLNREDESLKRINSSTLSEESPSHKVINQILKIYETFYNVFFYRSLIHQKSSSQAYLYIAYCDSFHCQTTILEVSGHLVI